MIYCEPFNNQEKVKSVLTTQENNAMMANGYFKGAKPRLNTSYVGQFQSDFPKEI